MDGHRYGIAMAGVDTISAPNLAEDQSGILRRDVLIGNANFDYMVEVLSERGKHGTGFVEKSFEGVLVGLSFFVLLVEIFGLGDDFILNSGQRSLGLASFFVLVILLVVKDAFVFLVAPGFF